MGDIAALIPRASSFPALSMDDWAQMFNFGNLAVTLNQTLRNDREEIGASFSGLVAGAFRSNSVVFGLQTKRIQLFSEARFQFQQMRGGRPGDLFGTPDLGLLERPEPGETTQDLLARILMSADFGGDAFIVRRPNRLKVLRPDWTVLILGSEARSAEPNDVDVELLGIIYQEGGILSEHEPRIFQRSEFAHYAPIKDPLARYRGMPWLVPVIREIQGDTAATVHKLKFFENGATPNMVVTLDPSIPLEKAREWIEVFDQEHKGLLNAYKTVYFGGGASAEVVGANLRQLDFKATQGAGETRLAQAAGIHPTIAGLSEGLQGSSLNAGNFGAARRLVADGTLRPLWGNLAGSLEMIIPPPAGSRLWYDDRHIPFLADDVKDAAEVLSQHATAIRTLGDGGWKPETVVDAVTSGDLRRLQHAGYLPVQVQPIQANEVEEPAALGSGVPLLAANVEVRCTGTRKDGSPCGALVGKRTGAEPVGFETKCDRCGAMVAA